MPHLFEYAPTGRAKCRGCGHAIAARTLRFGERVPNPFGDEGTETTRWYHVTCAALTRPEAFLRTLPETSEPIEQRDALEREAALGAAHERLSRARGAGRAPTGRAACRSCREPIAKDAWRISLAYYEDGRFVPAGYVHTGCARAYFGTFDLLFRLGHFSPGLNEAEFREISAEIEPPAG
jgi:hypothetical protein